MQGSQPVGKALSVRSVPRRSIRCLGCRTPPPAACQTPRRPSPKAPSMGADLDRTSACARTMLGIFEPECRVPGLRQSAAALLRQIAWAGLSGRVTAEALPRCFGGVRRAGSEHLTVQRASLPFGATLRGSPAGAGEGLRPFNPPLRPALRYGFAAVSRRCGCFSSLPCPRAAGFSPWTFRRVESPTVSSTSDARDDSPKNPLSPFPSLTESSSTRLDVASLPYPANHLTGDSRSSTRRASLPPGCGRCPFPDTAIPP